MECCLLAMSEFKFACPVCGQHITADSSLSGSKLECPTCYRKIIVPQAPTAQSKFILSAAQADRPRPQAGLAESKPACANSRWKSTAVAAGWVVVLGAAAIAAYTNQDRLARLVKRGNPSPVADSNPNAASLEFTSSAVAAAASNVVWRLDLANAAVPDAKAAGRIHGTAFLCEHANVQGDALTLRMGRSGSPELAVTINLPAARVEDLERKSFAVSTDHPGPAPRVLLRWHDADQKSTSVAITDGYAMKLEFGAVDGNHISGRIYLCTPDEWKSAVAGTFRAEIRKPAPQKQQPEFPKRSPIGGA